MFRRHWSGLPKDVSFPSSLEGLGYFVNDEDEIRSIENPDCYFKFFLNKNTRINERQRFAFNGAMQEIIHDRLEKEGLQKTTLPREAKPDEKHCPIFITPDLASRSRVVVVFGEPTTELGALAYRVANGAGGLNRGSMVSLVHALHAKAASPQDKRSPGIVLANMGQRCWWPEGKRALTIEAFRGTPLPSLVHSGIQYVPELNDIPGSKTPAQHMQTIFDGVLKTLSNSDAKIDIIAIGGSCETIENFLDDKKNWDIWGARLNAMVLFGTVFETTRLTNNSFKEFLAQRTRGYLVSPEPLNTPIASPTGNPSLGIEHLGCPCYSSSEMHFAEMVAIRALDDAVDHLQEVAMTPGFTNPSVVVVERSQEEPLTQDDWNNLADEEKPAVSRVNNEVIMNQVKELRRWRKYEKTGQVPDWSDDEESEGEKEMDPAEAW